MEERSIKERAEFVSALMVWCFKWGCEVQLRNKAQNVPIMRPGIDPHARGEFHEEMRDGTLVDMSVRTSHKTIEMPELVFSRGDRHVALFASSWDELMNVVFFSYKKIYMDLSIPMMQWEPKK